MTEPATMTVMLAKIMIDYILEFKAKIDPAFFLLPSLSGISSQQQKGMTTNTNATETSGNIESRP